MERSEAELSAGELPPGRDPASFAPAGVEGEAERPGVSEESFRLLVESVQDYAIFMLDPDGRVATWNAGAERIKGWTADEILGRHFSTFYPEEDLAARKPEMELEVAARVGRYEDEGWRVRKDGSRFWANVVVTALFDREGSLRGFAKVTRDFTERRASDATARRLAEETAARRAAQAGVAQRDEFIAIAGHELRTPLTGLLFHAESLERSAATLPPHEVATRAGKIARSARRLGRLVDELLDVSRIATGRLLLEREPVDLAVVVRETVSRAAERAARVGSELHLHAERVVGEWDRLRLEQIADVLVSNAVKYGAGSPIDVRVEARGGIATLSVRDRGDGVDPDDQERIFERFERAVSSRYYGGFGLGLWIARQIAEAHGGSISVSSVRGEGAEFTVELPLRPARLP